jgi:iron-sulfur cluster repair protein YtfE (RIC family)
MAKRHHALVPLTHDHHHALAHARKLLAAAGSDTDARRAQTETFLAFYDDDVLLHFHEEEEVLFPHLVRGREDAPPELVRVLVDHVRIHGLVGALRESLAAGDPDATLLSTIGETLRAHVRLEENVVFPLIEATVPEPDLESLRFAERDRGQATGA